MKFPTAKTLMAFILFAVMGTAQAAIVTLGSLSRDSSSAVISDSRNGREWLSWDVTQGLTYEQTAMTSFIDGVVIATRQEYDSSK